jgi:hypothetical protein
MVVCGCGPSLNDLPIRPSCLTIGVNDVGRLFDPDYLVVVNPPAQFPPERRRPIEESRARAVFTQYSDWRLEHARRVPIALGAYGGSDFLNPNVLHYTRNSPYVALCLAIHMGAARIGLIGVDFTNHHFFGPTGAHPLAGTLPQIDAEYSGLRDACAARGVEIVNLSPVSRLTAFPRMQPANFLEAGSKPRGADESIRANLSSGTSIGGAPAAAERAPDANAREANPRVFFVHHRFITCGDVLTDGLRHAAEELSLQSGHAYWDDPQLPEKVSRLAPDLLWVVNGRMLVRRWGARFREYRSAVWLVDEPYEVDDTAAYSRHFSSVFINDPATLTRHQNSYYLPLCYDPRVHFAGSGARNHRVGFVGAANPTRERFLVGLAERGLLSYVVGGPWSDSRLQALCVAPNIPASRTAELYRDTDIVVNVFRDQHHFNQARVAATSMNPRIYEALACGALVVSEARAEIAQVFPVLPQFEKPEELVSIVRRLLADPVELAALRTNCRARLAGHTYGDRLQRVTDIALEAPPATSAELVPPTPGRSAAPSTRHLAPTEAWLRPEAQPGSALLEPRPLRTAPSRGTEPLALTPLAGTPGRHLLYHLWPVRGSTWRWNVEQLMQRVDLFNGRRICAIVSDECTEDPATVRAAFNGHGFEFIEMPNAPHGEAATFPRLLEMVESEAAGDVSYYAHAKGVKYEPAFPPAVKRWAEVQYAVTLDHWSAVRAHLDRFAMTGLLRRLGRVANHQNVGDWHYSGNFFWFRHDAVFGARLREVPQFYGGVEAWPGTMFSQCETGCLLLDNQHDLAYRESFWNQLGNPAFARWEQAQRTLPAPPDLAQPPPFEGHSGPRLEQRPDEFAWWLEHLLQRRAKRILIIGAGYGGDEWHVARRFREVGMDIHITTLCAAPRREWAEAIGDARSRFGQAVQHEANREALSGAYDAVFIDGDHGWHACMSDVQLALSLQPQLIGLHDIVDSDWHAQNRCAVSRVWASLRHRHFSESRLSNAQWAGIGIISRSAP